LLQLEDEVNSLQKPELPPELEKTTFSRRARKKVEPIAGKKPETDSQMIGYMASKPEFSLQLFGPENATPMHNEMHLYGFNYLSQY